MAPNWCPSSAPGIGVSAGRVHRACPSLTAHTKQCAALVQRRGDQQAWLAWRPPSMAGAAAAPHSLSGAGHGDVRHQQRPMQQQQQQQQQQQPSQWSHHGSEDPNLPAPRSTRAAARTAPPPLSLKALPSDFERRKPDGNSDAPHGHAARAAASRQAPLSRTRSSQSMNGSKRRSTPSIAPSRLTTLIKQQTSIADLTALVQQHWDALNAVHVAAISGHLVVLVQQAQKQHGRWHGEAQQQAEQLLQRLQSPLQAQAAACEVRQVTTITHAWAKLGHRPPPGLLQLLMQELQQPAPPAHKPAYGAANAVLAALKGAAPATSLQQQQDAKQPPSQHRLVPKDNGQEQLAATRQSQQQDTTQHQPLAAYAELSPQQPGEIPSKLQSANIRPLANLAWALSKLHFKDHVAWAALSTAIRPKLQDCTANDVAVISYAWALARQPDLPLFAALAARGMALADDLTPWDISNTLWAFATAVHPNKALFASLGKAAAATISGFTPHGISNTIWAYATAGISPPAELLSALDTEVSRRGLSHYSPQNLSMLLWALAKLRRGSATVFMAGVNAAVPALSSYKASELSLLLWSVATAGLYDPLLFEAAAPLLARQYAAEPLNARDTCNAVWAYGSTRHYDEGLLAATCAAAAKGMRQLARYGLSVSLLFVALARLQYRDVPLAAALESELVADQPIAEDARRALANVHDAQPVSSGATLTASGHSTSSSGSSSSTGTSGPVQHQPSLAVWQPSSLASLAWALASLNLHGQTHLLRALLRQYAQAARSNLARGNADKRSNPSGSWGERDDTSSWQGRQSSFTGRHDTWSVRGIAHMAWACAVLNVQEFGLLAKLLHLLKHAPTQDFGPEDLAQLFQVQLWLQDCADAERTASVISTKTQQQRQRQRQQQQRWQGDTARDALHAIPDTVLQAAHAQWYGSLVHQTEVSDFQEDLAALLQRLGLRPALEVLTVDGLFSIDILVEHRGCMVAVEANGPSHYALNGAGVPTLLGAKQLRNRLLGARGYCVLDVASYEWEEQRNGSDAEMQAWLFKRLNEVVDGAPSRTAALQNGARAMVDLVELQDGAMPRQQQGRQPGGYGNGSSRGGGAKPLGAGARARMAAALQLNPRRGRQQQLRRTDKGRREDGANGWLGSVLGDGNLALMALEPERDDPSEFDLDLDVAELQQAAAARGSNSISDSGDLDF